MKKTVVANIKNKIANGELEKAYKNTGDFKLTMPDVWDACIFCTENYLDKIIFANDILCIPPTKSFLELYKMINPSVNNSAFQFTGTQSQKIGAFWGFVFQFELGYKRYEKAVPVNTLGVKKASRFVKEEASTLTDYMSDTWEKEEQLKHFVIVYVSLTEEMNVACHIKGC